MTNQIIRCVYCGEKIADKEIIGGEEYSYAFKMMRAYQFVSDKNPSDTHAKYRYVRARQAFCNVRHGVTA